MKIYYVVRFSVPEGSTLYAGYSQKNRRGTWGFASESLCARRFNTARMAKRVAQNAPPYKQLAVEGCSWEVVEITEKVIERAA